MQACAQYKAEMCRCRHVCGRDKCPQAFSEHSHRRNFGCLSKHGCSL